MSNIGDVIRNHRQEKQISLQELALKTRCGVKTIEEYERGERTPDLQTILKISTTLDIPASQLLKESNSIYS